MAAPELDIAARAPLPQGPLPPPAPPGAPTRSADRAAPAARAGAGANPIATGADGDARFADESAPTGPAPVRDAIDADEFSLAARIRSLAEQIDAHRRQPWPKTLAEQARAVRTALAGGVPVSVESLAARFQRAPRERVAELLETLVFLGQAQRLTDGRFVGV